MKINTKLYSLALASAGLILFLIIVSSTASATSGQSGSPTIAETRINNPDVSLEKNAVIEATKLEQINTSLQKGPVLLKIGAKWCKACQKIKPRLEELAAEYKGKATIMSIDIDQSPELTKYFGIYFIPDSSVIVDIQNGQYVYMQQDGETTNNRFQARIIGYDDTKGPNKTTFENVLDLALFQEERDKSK